MHPGTQTHARFTCTYYWVRFHFQGHGKSFCDHGKSCVTIKSHICDIEINAM